MALLLVLLCVSLLINKGEGSHCMATTSGAQHELSLYLRVCCVNSNLGQGVKIRQDNVNMYNCVLQSDHSLAQKVNYIVLYVLL